MRKRDRKAVRNLAVSVRAGDRLTADLVEPDIEHAMAPLQPGEKGKTEQVDEPELAHVDG